MNTINDDYDVFVADFFLQNLAFCLAVNRNPNHENIHSVKADAKLSPDQASTLKNMITVPEEKSTIKHYKPIYLFFVNNNTKIALEIFFKDLKFNELIPSFNYYLEYIKKKQYNDVKLPLINFFHLIGTLRLLKDHSSDYVKDCVLGVLNDDSESIPLVIKYSALQTYAELVFRDLKEIDFKNSNRVFKSELLKVADEIEKKREFCEFVATYSIYYYEFENSYRDICIERLNDILKSKPDNFLRQLFLKLPHVHSILAILIKSEVIPVSKDFNSSFTIIRELYNINIENEKTRLMVKNTINDLINFIPNEN